MKSAYGLSRPREDAELTHVGPGTPMGELMRAFWQPVAVAEELGELPREVRILGEDLIIFRTKQGAIGCLEPHCAHHGTSLVYGRIEDRGIRCCYHGWLYDAEGVCIEMPCEALEFVERMAIRQPGYPTHVHGGLVFVYMGHPEKKPLFPMYDIIDTRRRDDVVLRGMRLWDDSSIGFVRDCNWLQHYENVVDPWHLVVLHQQVGLGQFDGALLNGERPEISFERTSLGVRYKLVSNLPNGNRLERYAECVLPNIFLVSNIHETGEKPIEQDRCSEVSWAVPVDDQNVRAFTIAAWPLRDGNPDPNWRPRTDTTSPESAPLNRASPSARRGERTFEERQRLPDDLEAQESQRPIAIHALENLGHADGGIVLLRRLLRESIERMRRGEDPLNIVRDPARNRAIETNAWNTVIEPTRTSIRLP